MNAVHRPALRGIAAAGALSLREGSHLRLSGRSAAEVIKTDEDQLTR